MRFTARLECPGYGGFTTWHSTTPDQGPLAVAAMLATTLVMSAQGNGHLDAQRLFTLSIEADGRLIYSTTLGKEPVKSIYDDETLAIVEEGFTSPSGVDRG